MQHFVMKYHVISVILTVFTTVYTYDFCAHIFLIAQTSIDRPIMLELFIPCRALLES